MFLYPNDIGERLDFDKIIEVLSSFCKGELARERCFNLKFFTSKKKIEHLLYEVDECQNAIALGHPLSLGNYEDVKEELYLLSKENYVLDIESIVKIIIQVRIIHELVEHRESFSDYSNLKSILDQIEYDSTLLEAFDVVFDESNQIKPSASPELLKIHKTISKKEKELQIKFEQLVGDYAKKGLLTDNKESYRNGRRVLSVQAENKRKIDGVIHDESSSGKTVFIEPQILTSLNNELYNLESDKRREIYKILKGLSKTLGQYTVSLDLWQKIIVRLDFIQAKAKLSLIMNGHVPQINAEQEYVFKNARNPFLVLSSIKDEKVVVPFNLEMNQAKRFVIISGPNAGGKSVTMKAVGCIIMMVHCGLLPPLDIDSSICVTKKLLCDIGDQQSVEDDLSTYSSRLENMKVFLEECNQHSFVLIDEFGSGTDPKVGGAIAEAVLDQLQSRKVYGLITTHYNNIKMYGFEKKGIGNAAMIFDKKELEPTYRLEQGKPGSSFAFEIAQKIGLPKKVLAYAQRKSGKNVKAVDDLLSELQEEKKQLTSRLNRAELDKLSLQKLLDQYHVAHKEYQDKSKRLNVQKKEIAVQDIDQENKELQTLITELRKEKNLAKAEKLLKENKIKKQELSSQIEMIEDELHRAKKVSYSQLEEGDWVKLRSNGLIGKIQEKDKKIYRLIIGDMVMLVKEKDILPSKYEKVDQGGSKKVVMDLEFNMDDVESELDIRGYRKHEAEGFLTEFLDNALLANLDRLTVIHGKGSGVLKKTLMFKLKEYDGIKKVYHPADEFGGDGVTHIEL